MLDFCYWRGVCATDLVLRVLHLQILVVVVSQVLIGCGCNLQNSYTENRHIPFVLHFGTLHRKLRSNTEWERHKFPEL